MMIRKNIIGLLLCLMIPVFTGCASDRSGGDAQTNKKAQLTLKIETGIQANLDKQDRPSPIMIRIYELKNPSIFEQADYFSLQDNDRILLGGDLISKEEFILRPEEQKIVIKNLAQDTEAIGIFTAFQDLSKSTWRKIYRLDRQEPNKFLPTWSQGTKKFKLALDIYAYDMILFDEQMNRF